MGSIVPTSNIGTGGATPAPPTPITYLTKWTLVGNSEVHGTEIWSCGEYNPIDGKYHILVQPQGGSIADIALDAPLRKVNDIADTIEFPSGTDGKALVTRNLKSLVNLKNLSWERQQVKDGTYRHRATIDDMKLHTGGNNNPNMLCAIYSTITPNQTYLSVDGMSADSTQKILLYDSNYNTADSSNAFKEHINGVELIYELETPTTELVDAPQIEEADSYTCEISQGAKAVEWSSFETDSE